MDYGGFYNGYPYGFSHGFSESAAAWGFLVILLFILGLWALSSVINITAYILRSIGLYKIASNRGISSPWLAWLPFIGQYRIGTIADDISARNGSQSYFRYVLFIGLAVSKALSSIAAAYFFTELLQGMKNVYSGQYGGLNNFALLYSGASQIFGLLGFAVYVLTIIALNKLYQQYRPNNAALWTVLSVILPFMGSIFIFIMRNDAPSPNVPAYYPPRDAGCPPAYPPYPGGFYPPPSQYDVNAPYREVPASYQPPRAPEPPNLWNQPPAYPAPPNAPWEEPAANTPQRPDHSPVPPVSPAVNLSANPVPPVNPTANLSANLPASPEPPVSPTEPWPVGGGDIPSWGVNDNPQNGR